MNKFISVLIFILVASFGFCQSKVTSVIGVRYYKGEDRSDFRPNEFLQEYLDSLSTDQYKLVLVNTLVANSSSNGYSPEISEMDYVLDVYESKFRAALEEFVPSVGDKEKVTIGANNIKIYPKDYFYRIGYSMRLVNHLTHEFVSSFGHGNRQRKSKKDQIFFPLTEKEQKLQAKGTYIRRKVDMTLVPFRKINEPFAKKLAKALYAGVQEGIEKDLRMVSVVERKKNKVKKIEVTSVAPYHSLKKQRFVTAYTTIDRGEYYAVESLARFSGVDMEKKICNIGWGKKQLAKAIDENREILVAQELDVKYYAPQPFEWDPLKIGVVVEQKGSAFTNVNLLKLASNIEYKLSFLKGTTVVDRVSMKGLSELKSQLKKGDITDKLYDNLETSLGVDVILFVKVLAAKKSSENSSYSAGLNLQLVDVKTGELLGAAQESIGFYKYVGDYNLNNAIPNLKDLFVSSLGWTPEVVKYDKIDKDERIIIKCRYPLVDGADYMLYTVKEENVAGKVMERRQEIGEVEIEDLFTIDCAAAEIEDGKKEIRKAVEKGMKFVVEEKGLKKREKSTGVFGLLKNTVKSAFNFNDYEITRKVY